MLYSRKRTKKEKKYVFFNVTGAVLVRMRAVRRSDLAVGAEVCGGDLKGDLIVGLFAHLLSQKVSLSHQGVGFHNLLPESREALTEQLIPDTHTHTHIHQETAQGLFAFFFFPKMMLRPFCGAEMGLNI